MNSIRRARSIAACLVVLLLMPTWVIAQENPNRDRTPTLVVSGEGKVSVRPDRALVELGATIEAREAAAAQEQVNQIMQRAIADLKAAGVAEEKMSTSGLSLHPVHRVVSRETGETQISGYRASNSVRLEIDDLARVGTLIDTGIKAGANQLNGLWFSLKDDSVQRREALRLAVRQAKEKADALADAAGVRLGVVQNISEELSGGGPIPYRAARVSAEMMTATPIQPGEMDLTANVTLEYRIFTGPGDADRGPATRQHGP